MLTYCTNIHPGEGWEDARKNLEGHGLEVKRRFSPDADFPLGLRISGRAAGELDETKARGFRNWCEKEGLFVLTVNAFPYGTFHEAPVKQKVYLPDWRQPERIAYTKRVADLLALWLRDGLIGSISTVPVAFREDFRDGHWPRVRAHIVDVLEHLARIRDGHGVQIRLAFEAEPRCVLETTDDVVAFFERLALPDSLRDFAGVCFDCCHQAVEFEEPVRCLEKLSDAGIAVAKVQVSSALRVTPEEVPGLAAFDEPTYLHQVVARKSDGALHRYDDLGPFLNDRRVLGELEECRVHFHVPVFAEHLGACGTTRFFLEDILPRLDPTLALEVETYSWDVLPESLRRGSVADSIVRELEWVTQQIQPAEERT